MAGLIQTTSDGAEAFVANPNVLTTPDGQYFARWSRNISFPGSFCPPMKSSLSSYSNTRDQRLVQLPVIFELVAAVRRSNSFEIIGTQRPAADIDFMCAIVQRLTGAVGSVPVTGVNIVLYA